MANNEIGKGAQAIIVLACAAIVAAAIKLAAAFIAPLLVACCIAIAVQPIFRWVHSSRIPDVGAIVISLLAVVGLLGVVGGLVSVAFVKLLLFIRKRFLKLPKWSGWLQPAAGGLLVGVMGWFVPQVLGVGYEHVGAVLNGGMALRLMVLLLVLKLFAVTTSYASGNAGGIFGPSLFLGAMLGGAIGTVAHNLLPNHVATPGAYALVGMGTAFAGIVRAPMTSVVMIFEITRDYAVIVPLMISNLISFFIASRLQKQPIYESLARQDGIHLPSAESRQQESHRQVILAMRPATHILAADMTPQQALQEISSSDSTAWPVSDDRGLIGVLSFGKLQQAAAAGSETKQLKELLEGDDFPHLHVDHPLSLALERMGALQVNALPVVNRANIHKLEGIVTLKDVLALYGVGPRSEA